MDNAFFKQFDANGYGVINVNTDFENIREYTRSWIKDLLGEKCSVDPTNLHKEIFSDSDYSRSLSQTNRHRDEKDFIYEIIKKYDVLDFLQIKFKKKWTIWDEGFGSLGLRVIRPLSNDGYLWSCKAWGPAKNVFSFSIMQFVNCPFSTISVIPRSHLLQNLPSKKEFSIHCKDEERLDTKLFDISNNLRPAINSGDMLITHPNTIHTEKNFSKISTRISLEFRILPL